eukprot:1734002-Rhodomonas_salina.2
MARCQICEQHTNGNYERGETHIGHAMISGAFCFIAQHSSMSGFGTNMLAARTPMPASSRALSVRRDRVSSARTHRTTVSSASDMGVRNLLSGCEPSLAGGKQYLSQENRKGRLPALRATG